MEPPWAVNEDQIIALEMPFSNPFFVKHHTSTASKRKFIRFTVYSSNPASSQDNPSQQKQYSPCHDNASPFVLRNHTLSLSEPASKFDVKPLLADNITMVSDCIEFSYEIWNKIAPLFILDFSGYSAFRSFCLKKKTLTVLSVKAEIKILHYAIASKKRNISCEVSTLN